MSRARVAVLKVASGQLSLTAAAAESGFSRRHLHRLLDREGGLEALESRSRRPASNPEGDTGHGARADHRAASEANRGWFGRRAGDDRLAHLDQEGLTAPAPATISRLLIRAGSVSPQPRKTPKIVAAPAGPADDHQITVADLTTGEVLSRHLIDPTKNYWRNQHKQPGR
jgi:hypothetical protein